MSIDIIYAKKVFKNYVEQYIPLGSGKIQLKIAHIMRTSQIAKEIAEHLNLSKEDTELAELIGLLHDIGRFEQLKRYDTYIDKKSINHGQFGCHILFEEGLIKEFLPDTREYDLMIQTAIKNHNRDAIEKGLDERTLLHAKLIRDADKVDICYILTTEKMVDIYGVEDLSNLKIVPKIAEDFLQYGKVDYQDVESAIDIFVGQLSYVFDFNFNYALENVLKNQYVDKIIQRANIQDQSQKQIVEAMKQKIDTYLREKKQIMG